MAGLFVNEGAESELLASPFAMLNSSSEPIDPDVNLEQGTQKAKNTCVMLKSIITGWACATNMFSVTLKVKLWSTQF